MNKMAHTQKLAIFLLTQLLTLFVYLSLILITCAEVHHFDSNILNGEHRYLVVDEGLNSLSRRKRDVDDVDPKCKEQEAKLKDVTKETFIDSVRMKSNTYTLSLNHSFNHKSVQIYIN